jgi:hypothetical protein
MIMIAIQVGKVVVAQLALFIDINISGNIEFLSPILKANTVSIIGDKNFTYFYSYFI